MATGAEDEAGVQVEGGASRRDRLPLLPLGHDVEPLPHGHGLVVFLPASGPVLLSKPGGSIGGVDARHPSLQLLFPIRVVGDVELDPRRPLHALQELVVHIVPVLPVLFQKGLEVLLVLDDQACGPVHGEAGGQGLQFGLGGLYRHLQPDRVHQRVPPTKKSATQPGPVWAPMTGPM